MGMMLNAQMLEKLAEQLYSLNDVKGITVTQFEFAGHTVHVRRDTGDARDGGTGEYSVIGLESHELREKERAQKPSGASLTGRPGGGR